LGQGQRHVRHGIAQARPLSLLKLKILGHAGVSVRTPSASSTWARLSSCNT